MADSTSTPLKQSNNLNPPQPKPSMPVSPTPSNNSAPTPPTASPSGPLNQPAPIPTPPPHPNTAPNTAPPPAQIKKSPFRFIVPVMVFLLLLGVGIFGVTKLLPLFTSSAPVEPEPVEIVYWGLWEPSQVLDQIIADFETQNPHININYQQQSHKDYRLRLQNSLSDGSGPDLFRFHQTWVPMLADNLATIPSDVISTGDYEQTFYPAASLWLRSSKGLVGIPLMFDGLGLFYNQEIMEAAGKTPPITWDELRRTAKQVTVKQENTILRGGVALGTTSNVDHWPDILGLMMLQNGADLKKPNTSAGQDALTFYTLFSQMDQVWDDTLPESTLAFATEKVVMMIAPSWRAHDVKYINPDIDFAIAPAPKLPDTDVTWASFWAEGVSTRSGKDEQQAAWQFLSYLAQKDTMRRFYQAASDTPGRLFGEPFSRVDLADQLTADPLVGAYINQASTAKSWFLSSRTWDDGLNDKIIKYYEDAINLVLQGEDVEEALLPTEQGIAQIYSQYGLGK